MGSTTTRMKGAALAVTLTTVAAIAVPAQAQAAPVPGAAPLTNLAHLDFLLDEVDLAPVPGHDTYDLATDPGVTMPWTYADARPNGAFERVGGGRLDPATGDYEQGAFNTDDIARAAIVYLRHWQQTGDEASREKAYDTLRALAYFQVTDGEDSGNVVLWMQADGELNPSAEPIELPDPSQSEESYWLARTMWAYGEGYAAFRDADPEFAAFLADRMGLAVGAVDRQVLDTYGETIVSDGVEFPAWLIRNGVDITGEAVLGLNAYVAAAPADADARRVLEQLAEGVERAARVTTDADTTAWPYGAILPWAESRTNWHAWSSQMGGALAGASVVLGDDDLIEPAIVDSTSFTTLLLASGGPSNAYLPSPTDTVQIAYGADSRLQNLLAVEDATGAPGLLRLAGLQAAWFFGLNPAEEPMYSPETGVTFDGIQPDGSINRNSGAESAIHGLLAALALDAHPEVAAIATTATDTVSTDGVRIVEAESGTVRGGEVVVPESSWTGESAWSGSYVRIPRDGSVTVDIGRAATDRFVEPVSWHVEKGSVETPRTDWRADRRGSLGGIRHEVGAQGVSDVPGALLPDAFRKPVAGSATSVTATVRRGTAEIDALLVRPVAPRLVADGGSGRIELVQNAQDSRERVRVGVDGTRSTVQVFDADGQPVRGGGAIRGTADVRIPGGGFAVVTPA